MLDIKANAFSKSKLLKEHWNGIRKNGSLIKEGHAKEFPNIKDAKSYELAAKEFLNNPPKGTLTGIRKGKGWRRNEGDIVRYHESSNTFSIMDSTGNIRTMYKPNVRSKSNPYGFDSKIAKNAKEYFYHEIRTK